MQTLELLAPAKDLECGIAAIDSGADAVYIGASKFGARASAGNTIGDIHRLCEYAHQFGAKVHVTVNTIIYDSEMEQTMALVRQLSQIGVDALLVQDMGLLSNIRKENIPLSLHASTQCDNRTAEKVRWEENIGFERAVLARELSASEIARIHDAVPDMELEVFVHGALCVSYSGQCYASQYCFNRSANRGECAQFCRLKFNLMDSDGKVVERNKYLLSLKDMCQADNLQELVDAGATAFKIEGRLKDADYVKNVVAAYNSRLNAIIARHPDKYCRESFGKVEYKFTPNLHKTFNRGYTSYFINGRRPDIFSPDTPKALGEFVGHIKELHRDRIKVSGTAAFANGDGLCFINSGRELEGFRVNRAQGNVLVPFKMPVGLKTGMALYRNNDQAFTRKLEGKASERRIPIAMRLATTDDGFALTVSSAMGVEGSAARLMDKSVTASIVFDHQKTQRPQHDNIVKQLSKLGATIFTLSSLDIGNDAGDYFIPSSLLATLRRDAVQSYAASLSNALKSKKTLPRENNRPVGDYNLSWSPEYSDFPYLYNIANKYAATFYKGIGLKNLAPAFELNEDAKCRSLKAGTPRNKSKEYLIMQCRHCLRYSLGYCVRRGGKKPAWHEPLYLQLPGGNRFRLEFKCDECQMNIYSESKP